MLIGADRLADGADSKSPCLAVFSKGEYRTYTKLAAPEMLDNGITGNWSFHESASGEIRVNWTNVHTNRATAEKRSILHSCVLSEGGKLRFWMTEREGIAMPNAGADSFLLVQNDFESLNPEVVQPGVGETYEGH